MEKFPVGFWNYTRLDENPPDSVKDWVDVGATITMGPEFDPEKDDKAVMLKILDNAYAAGIKVIMCDARTNYWYVLNNHTEAEFEAVFKQAVDDFGAHPALFGFHLGDEPGGKGKPLDAICLAGRLHKKYVPHLKAFSNLHGYYPFAGEGFGFENFGKYLDYFVQNSEVPLLCYDTYTQMNPEEDGTNQFFLSLHYYMDAAKRNGIEFWSTPLSVGHYNYRCPKEDDLRWQLHSAVACGAKGIQWFFMYMNMTQDNYRVAPIDEHWERTETFEWLSRVNRTFQKQFGEVMTGLTVKKVQHAVKAYGDYRAFKGDEWLKGAESESGVPFIVSQFEDKAGGTYIMIVNNSPKLNNYIRIYVNDNVKVSDKVWSGWTGMGAPGEHWGDRCIARWLHPGQMLLYKVEKE